MKVDFLYLRRAAGGATEHMCLPEARRLMETHFFGASCTVKAILPHMPER